MRRLLAGAAVALALLLAAPAAGAQDGDPWAGSTSTTPGSTESSTVVITARFVRSYNDLQTFEVETYFTTPGGLPSGCDGPGERTLHTYFSKAGDTVDTASDSVTTSCNGAYGYRVVATLDRGPLVRPSEKTISGEIRVAAPPPEVPKAAAARAGTAATVSWTPVASPPADFLGYRVERRVGDGSWEPLGADLPVSARSVEDPSPPAGAEITYRVRARRAGPDGQVLSSGQRARLPGDSTTPPPSTDGSTTVPGGDGSTTVPAGQVVVPGGGGSRIVGGRSTIQPRGRTGVGTRAPRLGTPSQANFPPLLTPEDGGFEEEIDYGDSLAGEEDGGEEELSSLFYEEDTGRGMAVPVATGFVLAAWAFHLRFLAKAARPVPVAVGAGALAGASTGRRGAPSGLDPEPLYEPVVDEPAAVTPEPYRAPAHYRPPTLADRYDPFADDRWA